MEISLGLIMVIAGIALAVVALMALLFIGKVEKKERKALAAEINEEHRR